MSNRCGDCLLFNGARQKCGGGNDDKTANSFACPSSFKGPARLFDGKKCGGCKLFNGSRQDCGAGKSDRASNFGACSNSYSPIQG